jgi:hypothetical protein
VVDESEDVFGGSVYRPRRRRGPLAKLGIFVFYLSSLLPAAWIAWHFDLVTRMGERLRGDPATRIDSGEPEPPVAAAPSPAPPPPAQPSEPSEGDGAVKPSPVAPLAESDTTFEPAAIEKRPMAAAAPKLSVDLDLSGRRQRVPLSEARGKRFRIAKVMQCPIEYELSPANGNLALRAPAIVYIFGRREVELRVSLESGPRGKAVVIEPVVRTDDGKEIPFILAGIAKIRHRLLKQVTEADEHLAALRAEQERLATWIVAPIVKPLATVGEAKMRIAALEGELVQQAAVAKSLEADLEAAAEMEALARQLHAKCTLEIAEAQ